MDLKRCTFHLVKTNKFQRDVQGDVLFTILDLPVFHNIVMVTIFHVHRCELFLPKRLPSEANTINWWWCYNCYEIHVHNICRNKLWALSSYFPYLHGFVLTLFPSRIVQFSTFFHVSNLIQTFQTDWVESSTQYSIVI